MEMTYEEATKEYTFCQKRRKIHIESYKGNGGKVEIPQFIGGMPVTKINFSAFKESEVTEVVIPDGIRYIGTLAFFRCRKLKKITICGRVDYCSYAFTDSAIEEIDGIENLLSCDILYAFSKTPFFEKTETLIIGDKLFWCRDKSEVITVPDYIKRIGYCAFMNSNAYKIILPEKLEQIYSLAFFNSSIRELYIPDSVIKVGANAFGLLNLEKIRLPEDFSRRSGWHLCTELGMNNNIINDTQLYPTSDDDILVYENVSCIAVSTASYSLKLRECQIFPERLELIKNVSILADAKVNIFKNDTFTVEKKGNIFFNRFSINSGRRFKIIFDFAEVYAEILFWIPFNPYSIKADDFRNSDIIKFYEKCLVNDSDGHFLDLVLYDRYILEQDIPFRIKAETACKRIKSKYRLSDEALENYRRYFNLHHKKLNYISDVSLKNEIKELLDIV